MCGIAAFSIPSRVKRNARALAHSLLTQIENRGSHASGFAYVTDDGKTGVYKSPTPGSQLPLHELPRNAKAVILHTRYATQGSPKDNNNNHPVISPDGRIALVHNGVISNDYQLRDRLGLTAQHGEVDSLVIPAILAQNGIAGLSDLAGYAAIAWLDDQDAGPMIHIAKLKTSPVAYTALYDGTFVMASTTALLEMALLNSEERYGGVFELAENRMITVQNGFIFSHEASPRMSYNHSAYARYSSATAGGHGSPSTPGIRRVGPIGSEDTTPAKPRVIIPGPGEHDKSAVDDEDSDITAYYADLERWRKRQAERDNNDAKVASKMLASGYASELNGGGDVDDDDDDQPLALSVYGTGDEDGELDITGSAASRGLDLTSRYTAGEGFYLVDNDGDMSHYPTLEDLEGQLRWLAKMSRTDQDLFAEVTESTNWVNHVWDIGAVDDHGNLVSWIEDMADIDDYESPAVRNLQYIREGAAMLCTLKGA